jgi:hypothetical protein
MDDLVKRLKEAAEKYDAANGGLVKAHLDGTHTPEKTRAMIASFDEFQEACDSATILSIMSENEKQAAHISALEAENKRLRDALKPFADEVSRRDENAKSMGFAPSYDEYDGSWLFPYGDLRRAKAALEG